MIDKVDQEIWKKLEELRDEFSLKIEELRIEREKGNPTPDLVYEHGYYVGKRDAIVFAMVLIGEKKITASHQLNHEKKEK